MFLVVLAVIIFSLAIAVAVGSAQGLMPVSHLRKGSFDVETCASGGYIPIINWTAKGRITSYNLEPIGECLLGTKWNVEGPGLYCTGIGELDGKSFVPDQCIRIEEERPPVRPRFRNVFKYRYPGR